MQVFILEYEYYSHGERHLVFPVNAIDEESIWLELRMAFERSKELEYPFSTYVLFRGNNLHSNPIRPFEETVGSITLKPLQQWLVEHNANV